jgi:hypothetical protein
MALGLSALSVEARHTAGGMADGNRASLLGDSAPV